MNSYIRALQLAVNSKNQDANNVFYEKSVEKMSRKLYNNRDKKERDFMASGIYTEVKKRIELAEPGTVFLTSDFTDIATTTTVRKCLGRQVEEKNIRRIIDGVYEKPVYSNHFKEYVPAVWSYIRETHGSISIKTMIE